MEQEFTNTEGFTIHLANDKTCKPKLLRVTVFPYPMLDLRVYDTRMQRIRQSRTGLLPNTAKAIKEYLLNNRDVYLFVGDTEYHDSVITLRCFENKIMIDTEPSRQHHSLILWSINSAYYKYINAIDKYERQVKKTKGTEKLTTDEVSDKPVPMLGDELLNEIYDKIEHEKKAGLI